MNEPYTRRLVNRLVTGERGLQLEAEAGHLPVVQLNAFEVSDLEMFAIGAYSPLEGFMTSADYASVVRNKRLASGIPWTLPITLAVTSEERRDLRGRSRVALSDSAGRRLGVLRLDDVFQYDREIEAREVFRTTEMAHPGVAYLASRGEWLLGGAVEVFHRPNAHDFQKYRLDPADTRRIFAERDWKR